MRSIVQPIKIKPKLPYLWERRVFNLNHPTYPNRKSHETGQGLVEYALILVLVAVVVIVVLALLGPEISAKYCQVITAIGGSCAGGSSTPAITQAICDSSDKLVIDVNYPSGAHLQVNAATSANDNMIDHGNDTYSFTFANHGTCVQGQSWLYIYNVDTGTNVLSGSITHQ
jgi:pilus assembly protein Flp/PilA